jgi:hypothetical protein
VAVAGVLGRKRESDGAAVGYQHAGLGGAVQTEFERKSEFKCFKQFKTVSKFGGLEKHFPGLRKIEIKYSFEDLEEMNNFLYRNFLRFAMDLG